MADKPLVKRGFPIRKEKNCVSNTISSSWVNREQYFPDSFAVGLRVSDLILEMQM
jgi:hypothetical protein